MASNDAIRWSILFSGLVQGVGFRYQACRVAQRLGVNGYVRNLPTGQVELVAESQARALQTMVDEICQKTHGRIDGCDVSKSDPTGEFTRFEVRH